MKTIFTLTRDRGSDGFKLALGPETPEIQHRKHVKKLRQEREASPFAEVVVCRVIKRFRLSRNPEPEKPKATKPVDKPVPARSAVKQAVSKIAQRMLGK